MKSYTHTMSNAKPKCVKFKALEVGNFILNSNSLSANSGPVTNLSYKINEARHRMAAVHHSSHFKNNLWLTFCT